MNRQKVTRNTNNNLFAQVEQADKIQKPAKVMISGPTNSGKTFGALMLLKGLTDSGKVLVVDSENKRSALHVGDPAFGSWKWDAIYCKSDQFDGDSIASVIKDAEAAGYEGIIIDSYTHIWEEVNNHAQALGGRFSDFNEAKKPHKRFLSTVIMSDIHVVCTARSKMDYSQDVDSSGKKTVVKLGLNPIGESSFAYEMDFSFIVDANHYVQIDKTTQGMFEDLGRFKLTEEHGKEISAFLNEGLPADYKKRQLYISRIRELLEEAKEKSIEVDFEFSEVDLLEKTADELAELGRDLKSKVG